MFMGEAAALRRFHKMQEERSRQAARVRGKRVGDPGRNPTATRREVTSPAGPANRAGRIAAADARAVRRASGHRLTPEQQRIKDIVQRSTNEIRDRQRKIEQAKQTGRNPDGSETVEAFIKRQRTLQIQSAENARNALQKLHQSLSEDPRVPQGKLDQIEHAIGYYDGAVHELQGQGQAMGVHAGQTRESERASDRALREHDELERHSAEEFATAKNDARAEAEAEADSADNPDSAFIAEAVNDIALDVAAHVVAAAVIEPLSLGLNGLTPPSSAP